MAEILRDEGFEVFEAASAHEALAILESAVVIDLVLTDVKMPGAIDGLGLARILRDERPELKIVVVSALLATPPAPDPADAYFLKPYKLAEVADCVFRLLEINRNDG